MLRSSTLLQILTALAVLAGSTALAVADPLPGGGELVVNHLRICNEDPSASSTSCDDDEFGIPEGDGSLSAVEMRDRYFNLAHCVCSNAGLGNHQEFGLNVQLTGATAASNRPMEMWVGSSCDNETTRLDTCTRIDTAGQADVDELATPQTKILSVFRFMNPIGQSCQERTLDGTAWLMVDTDADGTLDYNVTQTQTTDSLAPPLPTGITAEGAEAAIQLRWTTASSEARYYQALCAGPDGMPVVPEADRLTARFQTARGLCGAELDVTLDPIVVTAGARGPTPDAAPDAAVDAAPPLDAAPDAMPTNLPAGLSALDPAYICGEAVQGAVSLRIDGLTNEVPYHVVLLAIDQAGNASGAYFDGTLLPAPVTDLWEDLHDRGSTVEGGFCLLTQAYGDGGPTAMMRGFRDGTLGQSSLGRWLTARYYQVSTALGPWIEGSVVAQLLVAALLAPLVVGALLWQALGLPLLLAMLVVSWAWRRQRRGAAAVAQVQVKRRARRWAIAAATLAVVAPSVASAQDFGPYWETGDDLADVGGPGKVRWHAGIKVGPFLPGIDAQLGMDPGPFEAMFESPSGILPVLEIDWVPFDLYGQLGFGASIGYMGKSAKAFEAGSDPTDPMRPRSDGDETSFRLVPMSLTAVYRFTYFDDRWAVPVVPYLRGGLAYYAWWMSAPSGSSSVIYPDGCTPDMQGDAGCEGNRARGGSLGVQGSLGLAVRAERLDADAAYSMRSGGIQHAGFYAELQFAKVDGFGDETKLSVGDSTWFAGANFEF